MNFPAFDHVTVPRMGAVQAILETIGPSPCPTANGEAKLHKQNGISASSANNRNNSEYSNNMECLNVFRKLKM